MVRYFSPCIHLWSTLSESVWKRRVDGCERLCSGDIFAVLQGDYFFFWMCAPLSCSSIRKKKLPLYKKVKKKIKKKRTNKKPKLYLLLFTVK